MEDIDMTKTKTPARGCHELTIRLTNKMWEQLRALAAGERHGRGRAPETVVLGMIKARIFMASLRLATRPPTSAEEIARVNTRAMSLREQTKRLIDSLTDKERAVMRMRFGQGGQN